MSAIEKIKLFEEIKLAKDFDAVADILYELVDIVNDVSKIKNIVKGEVGDKGDKGDKGETGKSITGPQGPKGERGDQGFQGPSGSDGKDGRDGKDGTVGPQGISGANGSPDTPEIIKQKLESLEDEDKLKISAIQNLEDKLKDLEKKIKVGGQVIYAGGGGGKGHIKPYDLSAFLNGILKTFSLPANWTVIAVVSASFPNAFRPIIDYTFTPTSITFTSEINEATTLATGQSVIVIYEEG